MEPCKPRIDRADRKPFQPLGRADREGKGGCCSGCLGDTHIHPGCISAAGAVSDLLNGRKKHENKKNTGMVTIKIEAMCTSCLSGRWMQAEPFLMER